MTGVGFRMSSQMSCQSVQTLLSEKHSLFGRQNSLLGLLADSSTLHDATQVTAMLRRHSQF